MANQSGIVKDLWRRDSSRQSKRREILNICDIVYQNEKILIGETTEIIITQNDGKDITLTSKNTLTLDQSSTINQSFSNETVSNLSTLRQAILNETDINSLQDTVAGGGIGATIAQDGVSLS